MSSSRRISARNVQNKSLVLSFVEARTNCLKKMKKNKEAL